MEQYKFIVNKNLKQLQILCFSVVVVLLLYFERSECSLLFWPGQQQSAVLQQQPLTIMPLLWLFVAIAILITTTTGNQPIDTIAPILQQNKQNHKSNCRNNPARASQMELNGEATRTVNITKCLWSRGTENRISNDESCRAGEERKRNERKTESTTRGINGTKTYSPFM